MKPIQIMGAPGSPYTRKMLAVLRYRRIAYELLTPPMAMARALPQAKVPLLPTVYLPNAAGAVEAATDSSPLIRLFETAHQGRSVIPTAPALRFLDMLIEDYGDEWLTKPMFHYRWHYAADIKRAGETLPFYRALTQSPEAAAKMAKAFSERQIGRLKFVGSNAITTPVIEASYKRLLKLLDAHLMQHPFLMGRRPGASDFAVFGQLTQLVGFDPTPMAIAYETAPRVCAWVGLTEDLSGSTPEESDWLSTDPIPASLRALLFEVGRTYVPVMLANARALAAGETDVVASVDGAVWRQQAFPYQGKCVRWLREAYAALDEAARATVDAALADTGCEALVHP